MSNFKFMNEFNISGMKCQSCVDKVTDALKTEGYTNFAVTLSPPKVRFETERSVSVAELGKVLLKAGDYSLHASSSGEITSHQETNGEESLLPLFVILSYIAGAVLLIAYLSSDFSVHALMNSFMGTFLVVFSMFKLLNLVGFADAYSTYDVIASRFRTYGLIYPFIELVLGVAYFLGYEPIIVNSITLLIMSIGSLGVYRALKSKRRLQCACLGTALKLPMTKVTLVEDLAMGLMALVMIGALL